MANVTFTPVPRQSDDNRWIEQFNRHVRECKETEPDVLLIGDSIIQKLTNFDTFWNRISSFHPLNLGIGGDRTQHVLWRVLNCPLELTNPRIIILHCGTNNHGDSADQISKGILKVVEELRKKLPSSFLIIWGLLPRGEFSNPACTRNYEVNRILKEKLVKEKQIELMCTGDVLRTNDNDIISYKDMPDFLHLSAIGYEKVFTPILDKLSELLDCPTDSSLQL